MTSVRAFYCVVFDYELTFTHFTHFCHPLHPHIRVVKITGKTVHSMYIL